MNLRSGKVMRYNASPVQSHNTRRSPPKHRDSNDDDVEIVDVKWASNEARVRDAQRHGTWKSIRKEKTFRDPQFMPAFDLSPHARAANDVPIHAGHNVVPRRFNYGAEEGPIKKRITPRRALGDISNRGRIQALAAHAAGARASRARQQAAAVASVAEQPECGICLMPCNANQLHVLAPGCDHGYCTECLLQYLKVEVGNSKYPIVCPGCDVGNKQKLDAGRCDSLLRKCCDSNTADALGLLVAKDVGIRNPKFCCNPQCAMVFDYEGNNDRRTARVDCPMCGTSTCVICSSKWHGGQCQRSKEEMELLKNDKYNECPGCSALVERVDGCNFIKCRCGIGFCFHCGTAYRSLVPTPRNQHGTPGCKCAIYQGTRYEGAVQTARNRHRAWIVTVSAAEKAKPDWAKTSTQKFNQIFHEEYRRARNAGNAAAAAAAH